MNALNNRILPALRRGALLVALLALALTFWLVNQPKAEGRPTDGLPHEIVEMTAPADFSMSADNAETAFQEDAAGFSAYYRFTDEQGNPVALDVHGITGNLLKMPDENSQIRARKAASVVDVGANFGIVTLPMVAAVGVSGPIQDVTVYYDDQGWIVAYLACEPPSDGQVEPTCEPAAAVWRHDPTDPDTADQALGNNLLVLAVNEVVGAHNKDSDVDARLEEVSHDGDANGDNKVKYYDWQNGECNAFLMFSATSNGGESDPVNFVIPHTIKTEEIHASAAALITRQQEDESETIATTLIDDQIPAMASADELLYAASFTLERDEGKTSLHRMSVSVNDGESAAGAVMLLYKRPN